MNRFYRVLHVIFWPLFQLLFPFTVSGLENLPKDRAVVLCANHASAIDPVTICFALPRQVPVRIMAKKELFERPFLRWLITKLGAFPIDRGHSDLNGVKTAIKAVRDGQNLLVFPEGTRVEREGQVEPKGGVVMIAMRTGAPLLPVYVGDKRKLFHRTHVVFGELYEPHTATRHGTAEEYQAYAEEVVRRAYALGKTAEKR